MPILFLKMILQLVLNLRIKNKVCRRDTHTKKVATMENNDSIEVTPSSNGEKCIGNGLNKDVECMCDECDHFLECYPEWDSKK